MNYCELKGQNESSFTAFDTLVAISDYEENFNVLDGENAGRSESGRMIRDVLGTFIGHKIRFYRGDTAEGFDSLWTWLKAHSVDDYITIRAADNQTVIEYQAYYTSGTRKLRAADINNLTTPNERDAIEINLIPMEAQITP